MPHDAIWTNCIHIFSDELQQSFCLALSHQLAMLAVHVMALINEVAVHQARLLLGWVTVSR